MITGKPYLQKIIVEVLICTCYQENCQTWLRSLKCESDRNTKIRQMWNEFQRKCPKEIPKEMFTHLFHRRIAPSKIFENLRPGVSAGVHENAHTWEMRLRQTKEARVVTLISCYWVDSENVTDTVPRIWYALFHSIISTAQWVGAIVTLITCITKQS